MALLNSKTKEFKIQISWATLSPLKWLDDAKCLCFYHCIQNNCNHTLNMGNVKIS